MDILRIYESLRDAGIKKTDMQEFVQGYEFYLERRKMGWVPIEPPCRLVYRTKDPYAMVIMPFLIPEYANKIWGVELGGVCFGLLHREVTIRPEKDVAYFLNEMNVRMFGEEYQQKRSLELPVYGNFVTLRNNHMAVDDTFTLLTYCGVQFKEFGESRYWISDKNYETPMVTKFDGAMYLPPFSDKRAKLRPVLHVSAKLDLFCSIGNLFATPKKEKFEACMLKLAEE